MAWIQGMLDVTENSRHDIRGCLFNFHQLFGWTSKYSVVQSRLE
jgi:hypothetical protein